MQYAAGALYTVSKVPAYNIGENSELATSGPENSTCDMLLMWRVTYNDTTWEMYLWMRFVKGSMSFLPSRGSSGVSAPNYQRQHHNTAK